MLSLADKGILHLRVRSSAGLLEIHSDSLTDLEGQPPGRFIARNSPWLCSP